MPLKKLVLKPGVNRENTRYTNEGGWYACDKIRFRQGSPEKIGGWARISATTFLGLCRSLWNWITLGSQNLLGVGTNLKFYIELGGAYNDITPIRTSTTGTSTLTNPIDTTNASTTVVVNDTAHGCQTGDLAYLSGAAAVGGVPADELNGRHEITVIDADSYSFVVTTAATSTVSGGGGTVGVYYVQYHVALTDPFDTVSGSSIVTVTDAGGGYIDGDFVTFSGATAVGGLTINGEYQITYTGGSTYTIDAGTNASSTANGGGSVLAAYQINVGPALVVPLTGWGASGWSSGTWGIGTTSTDSLRLWSQGNFGEDLIFGPRGGAIYYWDATDGVSERGVELGTVLGASDVPIQQNYILISDINRFVFAFGTNDWGTATVDPMLIRWSDQEDATNWTPSSVNQAGSLRLSRGTQIVTAMQARQEILVWTDASLYSLQYVGAPIVWGAQLVGETISIISQNAVAYANGVAYWMGIDKFYKYDGRTQTLRCDLRQYVFKNLNYLQEDQVFAGTNEAFNEVWWFYCAGTDTEVGNYVVYNYMQDVWYYGTMSRTAWFDSGLREYPIAATYSNNIVEHELGVDDNETATTLPIESFITSSQFDLDDGHQFAFVWRMLPDITFRGSTATNPSVTMGLLPLANSGSGYNNPLSEGGSNDGTVTRTSFHPVEEFTGQINTRVRGRQMAIQVTSEDAGVTWQLGAPRIDMRPDGRR
jgi:hypothetical protein